jgi:hypothetical protein
MGKKKKKKKKNMIKFKTRRVPTHSPIGETAARMRGGEFLPTSIPTDVPRSSPINRREARRAGTSPEEAAEDRRNNNNNNNNNSNSNNNNNSGFVEELRDIERLIRSNLSSTTPGRGLGSPSPVRPLACVHFQV